MSYRLWVSASRTILVRMWDNGIVEVATRLSAAETWGPPVRLEQEYVPRPKDGDIAVAERRYETWLETLKDHGP